MERDVGVPGSGELGGVAPGALASWPGSVVAPIPLFTEFSRSQCGGGHSPLSFLGSLNDVKRERVEVIVDCDVVAVCWGSGIFMGVFMGF